MTKTRPVVDKRRMYSMGEACGLLRVGRTTMWRARKAGVVTFVETEDGLRIRGSEILALWERHNMN